MSTIDLDAIRRREQAATPGPWRWGGDVDHHEVYLSTVDRGRIYIMRFVRWGMRSAQPLLQSAVLPGLMKPAAEHAIREQPYRGDIARLDHPDAEFIAHARADIPALLAEIDRLTAELAALDPAGDGR